MANPPEAGASPQVATRKSYGGKDNEDTERTISVLCRIRPLNGKEIREQSEVAVAVDTNGLSVDVGAGADKMHFDFDAVVGSDGTQEDVYNMAAKSVVEDYLEGFNGTIFAYGQTGAGKTYTMEGVVDDPDKRGLLPRMVCSIFDFMERSGEHMQFMIQVQFLEIYNEKIRDLLAPDKDNLKVREDKTGGIYVEGATSHYITTEMEVQHILEIGAQSRATAETFMNQASSRSHSIFIITLEQTNTNDGSRKKSKLFMVDLAGSEMVRKTGASGETLKEAQHINKSLSALSNVIFALSEGKASHIPYRDSKLTRILQEAIGGNCRTALIINCSPARINEPETISTMRFGKSAKRIKNKAHINKEQSPAELKMLLEEMKRKNKELSATIANKNAEIDILKSAGGGGEGGAGAAAKMVEMKEEMQKEKELREAAEEAARAAEQKMGDMATEQEDALDDLRGEVERLQGSIAQKDAELDQKTAALRDIVDKTKSAASDAAVRASLDKLAALEAQAAAATGEDGGAKDAASFGALLEGVKALAETMKGQLQGGGPRMSDADAPTRTASASQKMASEAEAARLQEELESLEGRYKELLESRMADGDDFTKSRLLQVEKANGQLLQKAKEDARLLEARELELQIFEKKVLQKNQRVQILEMLLQDTRQKCDMLKSKLEREWRGQGAEQADGNRDSRRIKTHKPIQGGHKLHRGMMQMQEGVLQQDVDSPVDKVRSFILKVQGKGGNNKA